MTMARLVALVLAALAAVVSAQDLSSVPLNDTLDLFSFPDFIKEVNVDIETKRFIARMKAGSFAEYMRLEWDATHCALDTWRDLRFHPACEDRVYQRMIATYGISSATSVDWWFFFKLLSLPNTGYPMHFSAVDDDDCHWSKIS
jgi:hypothetical protein